MSVTHFIVSVFRKYLPSPFVIALLLSALTLVLAMAFGAYPEELPAWKHALLSWENGLWNPGLLVFAYQMMLILVLGHVVVLSRPMEKVIGRITSLVRDGASAALLVAVSTVGRRLLQLGAWPYFRGHSRAESGRARLEEQYSPELPPDRGLRLPGAHGLQWGGQRICCHQGL